MTSLTIKELPYHFDSNLLFDLIRPMKSAVFLDSASPYSKEGRYDIISANPIELIIENQEKSDNYKDNINHFVKIEHALTKLGNLPENTHNLPFCGGAIGYIGYDIGRQITSLKNTVPDASDRPIAITGIYSWAIINDHHLKKTLLVFHPNAKEALIEEVQQHLNHPANPLKDQFKLTKKFQASNSKNHYESAFNRIKNYINAGDCYQVNLAQRFSACYEGDEWQAYLALRKVTAAPYSAFLEFENTTILSLSPEQFLHVSQCKARTSPIKGTRKRSTNPQQDYALSQDLIKSTKDRAENLMIVDLLRNDLGRNCIPGSIHVEKLFELQSFETVHHLVSTITGALQEDKNAIDLLAGCFPGGSITGAPKIRAMEIIEELEPHRRSVYCGSIGYLSCDGKMDTNIAIRTLACDSGRIDCWAGGGIVADSQCEDEYQECLT